MYITLFFFLRYILSIIILENKKKSLHIQISVIMDDKLKILFVGPASSGKSTLVNFLSGFRETPTSRYYATNPLRIIET